MSEIKTLEQALKIIAKYEENGPAKLYYALNRKCWEIADMLNAIDMAKIELDDKDSKQFDRVQKTLGDATKIAESCRILEGIAGITGNETADVKKLKPITPQSIARGEDV
jgi:hypothetical protein